MVRDHARTSQDAHAELQKRLILFSQQVAWPSACCAWTATPISLRPTATTPVTRSGRYSCFRPHERLCRVPGCAVCGWLLGGEAECFGVGLAVVPGQDFAGFPGRYARVRWHIWQRVTGRWVTVTGNRRDAGLLITSYGASPAAVGTRCLVLAAMFTACGIPDLHCMGPSAAVAAPRVAGDGVRPVGCPCPGPPGTVPPASAFRARHPGSSHSHRAARCAPPGGCTSLGERRERLKAGPATVHYAPRRAKRHAVAHCRARGEQGPRTAGR